VKIPVGAKKQAVSSFPSAARLSRGKMVCFAVSVHVFNFELEVLGFRLREFCRRDDGGLDKEPQRLHLSWLPDNGPVIRLYV
jgi:hypothetical protein